MHNFRGDPPGGVGAYQWSGSFFRR
jgi:hypothetical protein